MEKQIINVLASDFENNSFNNCTNGIEGCPMERALHRTGLKWVDACVSESFHEAHCRIREMFDGKQPIEDFSFEL